MLVIVYHASQTVKNKFILFSRLHTYFIYYCVYGMRRTITRHRMNTSSSSSSSAKKSMYLSADNQAFFLQQSIHTQSQKNVENNEKHKHLVMFYTFFLSLPLSNTRNLLLPHIVDGIKCKEKISFHEIMYFKRKCLLWYSVFTIYTIKQR